jgi:hypothetical protein
VLSVNVYTSLAIFVVRANGIKQLNLLDLFPLQIFMVVLQHISGLVC